MKIQKLLSSKDKWTTVHLARDLNNESTFPFSSEAVCWCLVGAIAKCYGANERKRIKIITKVERALNMGIAEWNDKSDRTFDDVRGLIIKLNI